jgi:lipopolysaccharide transport system permease protein
VQWPPLPDGRHAGFVVPFFCGLSVFLFFSDIATSSVSVFSAKRNFVKKSPFPLWVLWLSNYLRACIQGGAYLTVALVAAAAANLLTVMGLVYAVAALVAILISCAAISLLLSSIGPFLGDIADATRLVLRLAFYSAPVTYPLAIVPEKWQFVLWFNPLTAMIEPLREAIVYGELSVPWQLLSFTGLAAVVLYASWWLFSRVSKAIPDVI